MARRLFHYRLQPLLLMKERARKRAEIALAKALLKLDQEKKKLVKLEEEKKEIIRRRRQIRLELHEKVSTGLASAKDGQVGINFLRKLEEDEKKKEEEIVLQKKTIEECETLVKRARRDYIDAVKELRVMEKHKALWWKKIQKELEKREEKELDELGMVIHELKKVA